MSFLSDSRHTEHSDLPNGDIDRPERDGIDCEGSENIGLGEEVTVNTEHHRAVITCPFRQELGSVPFVDWLSGTCFRKFDNFPDGYCEQCRFIPFDERKLRSRGKAVIS